MGATIQLFTNYFMTRGMGPSDALSAASYLYSEMVESGTVVDEGIIGAAVDEPLFDDRFDMDRFIYRFDPWRHLANKISIITQKPRALLEAEFLANWLGIPPMIAVAQPFGPAAAIGAVVYAGAVSALQGGLSASSEDDAPTAPVGDATLSGVVALAQLYQEMDNVERRMDELIGDGIEPYLAALTREKYESDNFLTTLEAKRKRADEARTILNEYRRRVIEIKGKNVREDIRYWEVRSRIHTMINRTESVRAIASLFITFRQTAKKDYSEVESYIKKEFAGISARPKERHDLLAYSEMAGVFNVCFQFRRNYAAAKEAMPDWFKDIIANLITNTVKLTPEGRKAELIIDYDPAQRTFIFTNSTPPIPEAVHQRIGREVVHGDPEKPGTGEGLLVNINLVQRHGGKMWVDRGHEADPLKGIAEKGPTFYIRLPPKEIRLMDIIDADEAGFAAAAEKLRRLSEDEALDASVQLGDAADEIVRRFVARLSVPNVDAETVRSVIQDFDAGVGFRRLVKIAFDLEPSIVVNSHRVWAALWSSSGQVVSRFSGSLQVLEDSIDIDGFDSGNAKERLERARKILKFPILGSGYEAAESRHELSNSVLYDLGLSSAKKRWDGEDVIFTVAADSKIDGLFLGIEATSWSEDVPNDIAMKRYLEFLGWTMKVTPVGSGTYEVRLNFGKK